MSQGLRYARMCAKNWTSTRDAIMEGCGLTPLARWSEWYNAAKPVFVSTGNRGGFYMFKLDGKNYRAIQREREVRNADLKLVTIKERRLLRVK